MNGGNVAACVGGAPGDLVMVERRTARQTGGAIARLRASGRRLVREAGAASGRRGAVCVIGAATLATLLHRVSVAPAPETRASVQTLIAVLALGCALVAVLRFSSTRRARDLGLFGAALGLAMNSALISALPAALRVPVGPRAAGASLCGELIFAAMFATASLVGPDRLIAGARFWIAAAVSLAVSVVGVAELGGLVLATIAGGGLRADLAGGGGSNGVLVVAVIVLAVALQALAALGFARWRRASGGAGTWALMLAACVLAAAGFERLSAHSWAAVNLLELLASTLMLYAAARGELGARGRAGQAATLAERRRVARDLHDGLAQDLAFIVANSGALERAMGAGHPVTVAASRALAISRSTISQLSAPTGANTRQCLETVAHEQQERFGISVAVEVDVERKLEPHARDHMSRIVREAIANAARHGGAKHVLVWLAPCAAGLALRVWDDGSGIGAGTPGSFVEGFGLRSMRERAASMGGSLSVHHPLTGGTRLECLLP